jgi:hypothetical protein
MLTIGREVVHPVEDVRKQGVPACGRPGLRYPCARVQFKITLHSAVAPPADALDHLWHQLGPEREEISFDRMGSEITATTDEDAPVSMTRDERVHIGRHAVLGVVREVCEETSELRSDWFAVSSEL